VSGGRKEVLQSGNEDEEAKQLFNSTFKGKYSVFMSKVCSLGALAKLRKVTISFVMSIHPPVCPFVCVEQLGSPRRIFSKFDIRVFFKKL
jgi:hypothetical protein